MNRRTSPLFAGLLGVVLGAGVTVSPARALASDPGEQLRRSVPAAAVLSFEILQPRTLLEPLLSDAMVRRVEALPIWSTLQADPKFQEVRGVVGLFEVTLGTDWRQALRELTGGGAIFAAAPGERTVLLVDSLNPNRLQKLHGLLATITGSEAEKRGEANPVSSRTAAGVTRWSFNGTETHAVIGSRLVAASDAAVFDRVMETADGPRAESLAGSPLYLAARKAIGPDPAAMLFLNLRALRHAPGLAKVLQGPRNNPLGVLLLGGLPEALQQADWLAVGFRVEDDALVARAVAGPAASSADAPPTAAFTGPARPTLLPDPGVPDELAVLRLHRDLHRFYATKDERFPERTSGLIFFENMMGIFFTGRDLTDEILAATQPELNFVVARQAYPEGALSPAPELPGFALVLRLRDPAAFRPVLEEAWQKALGLVNFTRGQQAEPGLILDRPRYGGIAYTTSHFSGAGLDPAARRDTRFNFQPTLAMPGEFAILSSSESLARRLIDALAKPAAAHSVPAPGHTALSLNGAPIAALLTANREALVRNNMIEEGHTRAEAELGIDTLLAVAGQVAGIDLSLAENGRTRLPSSPSFSPAEPPAGDRQESQGSAEASPSQIWPSSQPGLLRARLAVHFAPAPAAAR